ncbi:MAG: hypothetical protein KDD58_02015 [Bdellovibrionales bacterium]|nr:hypothetical protein [Bdellovibrionales bacterium]
MNEFKSESYAKCIIAGEHSVLRGHSALVVPVKSRALKAHWSLDDKSLELEFSGKYGRELSLIFGGALDQACKNLGIKRNKLKGKWRLENEIQLGGGLGASAAICVTIARYFVSIACLKESEVYKFSQELEDLFHGESSGVDIAASMNKQPIQFARNESPQKLEVCWNPHLYLSYSGHKGLTSECVEQVKNFILEKPERARELDGKMQESVEMATRSLGLGERLGFQQLKTSLDIANSCFEEWGLIDSQMREEMNRLKSMGASAIKPTGSGRGGYILSLWGEAQSLADKSFIPLDMV